MYAVTGHLGSPTTTRHCHHAGTLAPASRQAARRRRAGGRRRAILLAARGAAAVEVGNAPRGAPRGRGGWRAGSWHTTAPIATRTSAASVTGSLVGTRAHTPVTGLYSCVYRQALCAVPVVSSTALRFMSSELPVG